jgi:hypothetical protein
MAKIKYIEKRFNNSSLALISAANTIIEEYNAQGFQLTLRQLYYQFVSRDIIPNTEKSYKNLGNVISDARLAGLIDWLAIVDRTRGLKGNSHWDSPRDIVETCASQFKLDLWEDQEERVEVWIEKDALIGVIERPCRDLDVPYFSCRGYTSQSEMWIASQRLAGYREAGQRTIIIHLGDHDPSGIDMSRDIEDRLSIFTHGNAPDEFRRIALNMPQVKKYNPPPNPAKLTDSRCQGYMGKFGSKSWELDALEPKVLEALIRKNVEEFIDMDKWKARKALQAEHREAISVVAEQLP